MKLMGPVLLDALLKILPQFRQEISAKPPPQQQPQQQPADAAPNAEAESAPRPVSIWDGMSISEVGEVKSFIVGALGLLSKRIPQYFSNDLTIFSSLIKSTTFSFPFFSPSFLI